MIDQTNEKRYFSSDMAGADASGSRVNTKSNPYLQNSAPTTNISGTCNYAKELNRGNYPKMNASDKNLHDGMARIRQLTDALNMRGDVINVAYHYLKETEESKELKGRSLEAKVAVCVLMASRTTDTPRKMRDIVRYTRTNEKEISLCYKKCKNSIFADIDTRVKPSDHVKDACIKLNLSADIQTAAEITADNFTRAHICEGKKP